MAAERVGPQATANTLGTLRLERHHAWPTHGSFQKQDEASLATCLNAGAQLSLGGKMSLVPGCSELGKRLKCQAHLGGT